MSRIVSGLVITLTLNFIVSTPVSGQIVTTVSAQNDLRFRGRSLSEGDPVATLSLSYDDPSGLYIGTSATVRLGTQTGLVAQQFFAGRAVRITKDTSLDFGVNGYRYTSIYSGGIRQAYAEVYAGVTHKDVSLYVNYTADYFGQSVPVVYVSGSVVRDIAPGWQLRAAAGVLTQTSGPPRLGTASLRYDLSIGASRQLSRLTLAADATLGGPGGGSVGDYYSGPWRGRAALVISARSSF